MTTEKAMTTTTTTPVPALMGVREYVRRSEEIAEEAADYAIAQRSRDEIRERLRAGRPIAVGCECGCECGEPATTTQDSASCCPECAEYAVDDDGEVVCSRDARYRDDGEWTGGGMCGSGAWVSRPRVLTDKEVTP